MDLSHSCEVVKWEGTFWLGLHQVEPPQQVQKYGGSGSNKKKKTGTSPPILAPIDDELDPSILHYDWLVVFGHPVLKNMSQLRDDEINPLYSWENAKLMATIHHQPDYPLHHML